jgi:hypothetical protein
MKLLRRAATGMVVWTAALGAMAALAVTPATAVPADGPTGVTQSRTVPDGVYGIALHGDESALLTSEWTEAGGPIVLLPPLGEPGYQEWEFVRDSRSTQLIRNLRNGLYLGLGEREPGNHQIVVAGVHPFSWYVRPGSAPDRVHISHPGTGLRLDRSPVLIYPPRVDIQEPRDDADQEWELTLHE